MAEALWLNDVLRHFSWAADRTKVSDTTGRTLAQAVCLGQSFVLPLAPRQQNSKLRSFRFSATGTELSDASGVALAQISKENFALHDFLFDGGESQLGDESGFAFAESLQFSALRSFCLRGSFCNLSEATCEAMAEALSKAHLMSFEFTALHLFANEKLSLCMRNALQRNSSLQSIKFQICQLDGDAACVMLQASIEKALQKIKSERVCENAEEHEAHELGCTCLQLSTTLGRLGLHGQLHNLFIVAFGVGPRPCLRRFQGALDTTALSNSDWGSAIAALEDKHVEALLVRAHFTQCRAVGTQVDEQDVKDAGNNFKSKLSCDSLSETDVDAAEAITTISSETPNWESMHGV